MLSNSIAVRRTVVAAFAVLSASVLQAGDASAARVAVKGTDTANLRFTAGSGEGNRTVLSIGAAKAVVRDDGARLQAGRGCTALSPHVSVCRATRRQRRGFGWRSTVSLRDGNDRARFTRVGRYSGGTVIASGGAGGDRLGARGLRETAFLSGGDGRDRITGSPADDQITGGAGGDVLVGGRGRDSLRPDPADATRANDAVEGGSGEDMVVYRGRSAGVTVDLRRRGGQGEAGENDALRGVEGVEGTDHDDVLTGTDSAENDLQGNGGQDTIVGLGGDDRVWGEGDGVDTLDAGSGDDIVIAESGGTAHAGPGSDQIQGSGELFGGSGDDTFEAGQGSAFCEEGQDTVALPEPAGPTIDPSCEAVVVGGEGGMFVALPLARGNDGLTTTISCDEEDGPLAVCRGTMSVRLEERVVASGNYDAGSGAQLTLPYAEGGREALGDSPKQVSVTVGGYTFRLTV